VREVKYRVWDIELKYMREVVEIGWKDGVVDSITVWDRINGGVEMDAQHFILLEYTGLEDKNGKEKFHNDIVIDKYGTKYIIDWDEGEAGFIHFPIGEPKVEIEDYKIWRESYTEIIGNIYENPGLLSV